MIAEFTVIGQVVRVAEFDNGKLKMLRVNLSVNTPGTGNSVRGMYINNITIWNENAIALAKRVMVPGCTAYIRGRISSVSASKKKGLSKDVIYFNAETFFVLKRAEKDIEEGKYKRELGDFIAGDANYELLPGDSEKNDGYYPTRCGDIPDYESSYDTSDDAGE